MFARGRPKYNIQPGQKQETMMANFRKKDCSIKVTTIVVNIYNLKNVYLLSQSPQSCAVSNAWRLVWPRLRSIAKEAWIVTRLRQQLTTSSSVKKVCLSASIQRWNGASVTKKFVMKMATTVLGIAQNHWLLSYSQNILSYGYLDKTHRKCQTNKLVNVVTSNVQYRRNAK